MARAPVNTPADVKRAAAVRAAAGKDDFKGAYAALVELLRPYEPGLIVAKSKSMGYVLNSTKIGSNRQPYMFAAVKIGKSYVSYYFMPIYMNAALQAKVSPQLKARMQGKACFNFKRPDPALFAELAALTKSGYEGFKKAGYI